MSTRVRRPARGARVGPPARLLPSDASYRRVVSPYNEAAARGRPRFVAVPRTVAEVRAVVAECRAAGLRMTVHATGHDSRGAPSPATW
jgi:FAD/FMN-containing dehydrogenase